MLTEKKTNFQTEEPYGNIVYDRLSNKNMCGSVPANDLMYCIKSTAGDWMGYRWYKFTDQPGIQRLNLDADKKANLQARIERLHTALNQKLHLNQWLKPPADGLPDLVKVDPAHLIKEFPPGMEVGYVPVAVYQGMSKPQGCTDA